MANTPSYSVIEQSPMTGVLAGALTAISGINQEIRAAKKAQDSYNSFADTLEAEGLTGDAAIYRRAAASETPNFMQAAMTGVATQRDLSMPFKQAIDLLDSKRNREAAMERAEVSATGSQGVEHRQNVRMIDSILSNDYDLARQEADAARKEMSDSEQDAIRDASNPELVKQHKDRWSAANNRYNIAVKKMGDAQAKRGQNTKRLSSKSSDADYVIPGGVDVPELPTTGTSVGSPEAMLLPDLNNTPVGVPYPENPVEGTLDVSSRALNRKKAELIKLYGDRDEIKAASSEKELKDIELGLSKVSVFKTQEEARKAGDAAAPVGYNVLVNPRTDGKGYTYRLDEISQPARKLSDTRWEQGDFEFFKGPGDVMYKKRKGEDDAEGIMLTDKHGAGITYTHLESMFKFQGENAGAAYQGPVAKPVGMSDDKQRKLPTVNRSTEHSNPNPTPPPTPSTNPNTNAWRSYLESKPTKNKAQ